LSASVALQDQVGKVLETKMSDRLGIADFCDLGFGLYDVTIGPPVCGQTIVRYVSIIWPDTREVRVTYHNCHGLVTPTGCSVLLRVESSKNHPISDATVMLERRTPSLMSDSRGRVIFLMPFDRMWGGRISRIGYRTETFTIDCQRSRSAFEKTLILVPL